MRKKKIISFAVVIVLLVAGITGGIITQAHSSINYSEEGEYEVSVDKTYDYSIYYPESIEELDGTFPLITWGNGTGCVTSLYTKILKHLASHGFVVVASNSTSVGTGDKLISAIDYMVELNDDEESVFYNKIDMDNIGATGHSQGAMGSINAACNDSRIKAIIPIQSPQPEDASKVDCPMFLITSTKDYIVYSSIFVKPIYEKSNAPTIYASLKNAGHTTIAVKPDKMQGYITAWFYMYLKDDEGAEKYFIGDDYLLGSDTNWTDVKKKNF